MVEHSTAIFAFFCIFWAGEKSFEKFFKNPLTWVYTLGIIKTKTAFSERTKQ